MVFAQVNLHALQSLVPILPALATQSGALVPPLVSALTANLASKNINIYNAASEALQELIKQIGKIDGQLCFSSVVNNIFYSDQPINIL